MCDVVVVVVVMLVKSMVMMMMVVVVVMVLVLLVVMVVMVIPVMLIVMIVMVVIVDRCFLWEKLLEGGGKRVCPILCWSGKGGGGQNAGDFQFFQNIIHFPLYWWCPSKKICIFRIDFGVSGMGNFLFP